MPEDICGIPVSATSETALRATDNFNRRLLRLDAGMEELRQAQDEALLNLYCQTADGLSQTGRLAEADAFREHWQPIKLTTPLDEKPFQQ